MNPDEAGSIARLEAAPEPMTTAAEKRAYSRGYAAGKRARDITEATPDLHALVSVVRARNARLEEELAQARSSRDIAKQKYEQVSSWMRAHVRITGDGTVLLGGRFGQEE